MCLEAGVAFARSDGETGDTDMSRPLCHHVPPHPLLPGCFYHPRTSVLDCARVVEDRSCFQKAAPKLQRGKGEEEEVAMCHISEMPFRKDQGTTEGKGTIKSLRVF